MRAIRAHPRLRLQLVVTGMHLLPRFGRTIRQIRADGWRIDATVPMQTGQDDPAADAEALGRGIAGLARVLRRLRSDVVLVLGDRIEAFAGAAAAACARIVVAHVHGGDRAAGDVDDSLRHAITKLAHVHFAATADAALRLRRLGEEPRRIFVVGAPGLDEIRSIRRPSTRRLGEILGWSQPREFALIVQHPCGHPPRIERRDMAATLAAVADTGLAGVIVYPNSDPGHSGIIAAIHEATGIGPPSPRDRGSMAAGFSDWIVMPSIDRTTYIRLLKAARVLVGNSSSGIIESKTAGVPVVNIGPRQRGRTRCGPNVIDCPYGRSAVRRAIRRALARPVRSGGGVYGDGRTGRRIAAILGRLSMDAAFRRKLITY